MARVIGKRQVRYIPQMEMAECGAASLCMVLDYHGCSLPLVDVRQACAVSRDGLNAARILKAARELGLKARGLKLEPAQLGELPLPAILHWELNHFLVLESIGRRSATLVDPALGRRKVTRKQLSESFSGVVLAFEPGPELPQRPHRSLSLGRYFAVLGQNKSALAFVLFAALLLELLGLLFPAASQVLIDHVVKPRRADWLLPLAGIVLVATSARFAIEWLRDRVLIGLQTALDLELMSGFVHHLLHLPLGFFQHRSSGDLMQRVDANGELRAITAQLVLSLFDAALLVGFAALMLVYDLRLGVLALGISLSRLLLVRVMNARARQISANLFALSGRENAALLEPLSAPEVVRALAAESVLSARYNGRMTERLNAEQELAHLDNGFGAAMHVFDGLGSAVVLWLGGSAVIAGEMTLGVFAGFLLLQNMIEAPLAAVFDSLDQWIYAQAVLTRVDDVLSTQAIAQGGTSLPVLRGEIVFDEVSFRYGPSSPWLFEKLTLRIAAGEKVALVGRSGQGKSTLMKLLLGVLQPTAGRILIDGVELSSLDGKLLARQLGVVLQEPFLLEDTVRQNLRLRLPEATHQQIEEAARLACVHEVVSALPLGYDAQLGGERGARLSGGQKQRLCIARALVGRPSVLLLDEATSSLDLTTEAQLHHNLGQLRSTRVLIAHRLATVRDADRILVIDGGGIAQEGSYQQLADSPGLFQDLVHA